MNECLGFGLGSFCRRLKDFLTNDGKRTQNLHTTNVMYSFLFVTPLSIFTCFVWEEFDVNGCYRTRRQRMSPHNRNRRTIYFRFL